MNELFVIKKTVDELFMTRYSLPVMLCTFGDLDARPPSDLLAGDAPVLVLDFDGTVCLGDGPVWAYAESVLEEVHRIDGHGGASGGAQDGADIGEELRAKLADFLGGNSVPARYHDGYAAVAALAREHIDGVALQRAYRASRQVLAQENLGVTAPVGLADLLGEFDGQVIRVIATNAPDDGVARMLNSVGLGAMVDAIATNMQKPAGWQVLLPELMACRDPAFVMAVGDIWANDVQPPRAAGCATALIDRYDQRSGPASLIGRSFEELYDGIRRWAHDPLTFAAEYPSR